MTAPYDAAAGTNAPQQRKNILFHRIVILVLLFFSLIILSGVYSGYRWMDHSRQRLDADLNNKMTMAEGVLNSALERFGMIAQLIRGQQEQFVAFLEYDKILPINIMLQDMAAFYDVDLILLFDDETLLAANDPRMLETAPDWEGLDAMETFRGFSESPVIFALPTRLSGPGTAAPNAPEHTLAFGSLTGLVDPSGEQVGRILAIRKLDHRRQLAERMAQSSSAQAALFNPDKRAILTSLADGAEKTPFPTQRAVRFGDASYYTHHRPLTGIDGKTVGWIAIGVEDTHYRQEARFLLISTMLPFLGIVLAFLVLFLYLKTRVFEKVHGLIIALGQVTGGDLKTRLPVPPENPERIKDEVVRMGYDFNLMMEKLESMYGKLEHLSEQLSKYLAPQLYESIFSGATDVQLSTKRKKLTVFFSDIKDFTSTTEDLQPEDLTFILNDYFTAMSTIALEHEGTINRFIGDAMLICFGDPETKGVQEDAAACVRMAIAMQRKMKDLRGRWRDKGFERPFHIRIGINTGYCNVGNFGSADRMEYTIQGGEVNLAARLEGKAEPDGIMISYETYALVRDFVHAEEGESLQVKGIRRKIRPFTVQEIYKDLAQSRRYIHRGLEGVLVNIDMDKLKPEHRSDAMNALNDVISELQQHTEAP